MSHIAEKRIQQDAYARRKQVYLTRKINRSKPVQPITHERDGWGYRCVGTNRRASVGFDFPLRCKFCGEELRETF